MLLTLALTACVRFPCSDNELLDADGMCHAPDAPADDTADSFEPPDDTADDTDSGPPDSGDSGDSADTGDSGGGPPADDGWPARFVAPYVDATAYPTVKVGDIAAENGVDRYTLGFVVARDASTCEATWGTYYSLDVGPSAWESGSEYFLYDQVATLRAAGGDVMVSFGGAANTPIEAACGSVEEVVAEYQRVIDTLELTRIDFDIEGSWLADTASVHRRSLAIAALQADAAAAGRALHVWYTLPVLPTGLTADGLAVVQDAVDAGVELDGVNVMTMDYGDGVAPNPAGQMGEYGIDAVEALHGQLAPLWPALDTAGVWARVGSTPMIGQNDVASEVFDVEDAEQTRAFAEAVGMGMLGYWSINRDHPCAAPTEWAQSTCNGSVDVPDWSYAAAFAGYGG